MYKQDEADKWFSYFIREMADWKCSKCGTQFERKSTGLHCSHFFSRRAESTRFLPDNADSHCGSVCHPYFTANPARHREWKLARLGARAFGKLLCTHYTMKKKNRAEEAKYWKQELKNLCEEKGVDFNIF